MKIRHKIDGRNPEERLAFENELKSARCYKKKRPCIEKNWVVYYGLSATARGHCFIIWTMCVFYCFTGNG